MARRLGVSVVGDDVAALVGLAVRRNPRRAHLLVSRVLAKHVPTDPRLVRAAGRLLGVRVAGVLRGPGPAVDLGPLVAALDGDDAGAGAAAVRDAAVAPVLPVPGAVVLGYCETATALGHLVAETLRAPYLHSTRRPVAGVTPAGGFDEEHSHAVGHLLLPADPGLLTGDGPLVLVDDELSTGRTVANTVRALHALHARAHYVVASLVDLRSADDGAVLDALAAELGVRVDVVALATGTVAVPDGVLVAGQALVAELERPAPPPAPAADVVRVQVGWPAGLAEGGRHGVGAPTHAELDAAVPGLAAAVVRALPATAVSLLVLGTEELLHAPLRLAEAVADARPDLVVRFSSTTRSPVLAVDDPGYAIRDRLVFPAHDDPADGPGPRFAYNTRQGPGGAAFDVVLVVVDTPADTPALHGDGGLLAELAATGSTVLLAVLPVLLPV
ncbi:hypothetical protein GCM10027047_06440 [Rhodococcus aerolatus]